MKPNYTPFQQTTIAHQACFARILSKLTTLTFTRSLGQIMLCALSTLPLTAQALDFNWSGFGTLGYVRSDQDYAYERVISKNGSFKRDSLLGLQLETTFSPKWSSTLQARYAPNIQHDLRWELELAWAFVSYRPANDWLLRVGKLRMPMYLFSENMDVSASYDVVRMPTEVYTTAPSADYSGISLGRTWQLGIGEFNVEAYAGKTSLKASDETARASLRTRTAGLVFKLNQDENVFHLGLQQAYVGLETEIRNGARNQGTGQNSNAPSNAPRPVDDALFAQLQKEISTRIILVGADLQLHPQLRLVAEYAKRTAPDFDLPHNSTGAYVTLLSKQGAWTPYASYARLLTDKSARKSQNNRNYFDQSTFAVGSSYALSTRSKLKAEWLQIRLGSNSLLLDNNAQYNANDRQRLNIFSLTYSAIY